MQLVSEKDISIDEQEPLTFQNFYRKERNQHTIRYRGCPVYRGELSKVLLAYTALRAGVDPDQINEEYLEKIGRESMKMYLERR